MYLRGSWRAGIAPILSILREGFCLLGKAATVQKINGGELAYMWTFSWVGIFVPGRFLINGWFKLLNKLGLANLAFTFIRITLRVLTVPVHVSSQHLDLQLKIWRCKVLKWSALPWINTDLHWYPLDTQHCPNSSSYMRDFRSVSTWIVLHLGGYFRITPRGLCIYGCIFWNPFTG